ncbi:MAG TPA: glycosyltransferase 87 family protein [Thermoanaerobaculia bacterium]|nr:glycosyltransferase 87 family protein [Thermoanaerobaculia bacterium]
MSSPTPDDVAPIAFARDPTARGATRCGASFAALAIGLRVALMAAALGLAGASAAELASLHDGRSYQTIAEALGSAEQLRGLPAEVRRLGPGYPALARAAAVALPLPLAALVVPVLAAGAAVWLLSALGASRWTVAYFAVFTPSWVLFSGTAMSEAPFLALSLAGVLLWRRDRPVWSGLVLGGATLVRPVGALVFASHWLLSRRRRGVRASIPALVAFAVLPGAWAVASWWLWGNPLQQPASYIAKDLSWPLHSLLVGLGQPWHDPLKAGQVVLALGLAFLGAIGLRRRWQATGDPERLAEGAWLVSHVCFYLLLPSSWVFECLPRFLVSCLPPILLGLEPWLPRRRAAVVAAGAGSLALGLIWNLRALDALQRLGTGS